MSHGRGPVEGSIPAGSEPLRQSDMQPFDLEVQEAPLEEQRRFVDTVKRTKKVSFAPEVDSSRDGEVGHAERVKRTRVVARTPEEERFVRNAGRANSATGAMPKQGLENLLNFARSLPPQAQREFFNNMNNWLESPNDESQAGPGETTTTTTVNPGGIVSSPRAATTPPAAAENIAPLALPSSGESDSNTATPQPKSSKPADQYETHTTYHFNLNAWLAACLLAKTTNLVLDAGTEAIGNFLSVLNSCHGGKGRWGTVILVFGAFSAAAKTLTTVISQALHLKLDEVAKDWAGKGLLSKEQYDEIHELVKPECAKDAVKKLTDKDWELIHKRKTERETPKEVESSDVAYDDGDPFGQQIIGGGQSR